MNKLFIILALFFYSCEQCADCTSTVETTCSDPRYIYEDYTVTKEVCGYSEIKKIEEGSTETTHVDGLTITAKTKTICNKR